MKRAVTAGLLILVAVPLLVGVARLPAVGSTENPAYTRVVPRYLEEGPEETGAENVVTAIILDYRGYDTSGEVTVIFTAFVAVLGVLAVSGASSPRAQPAPRTPASPVVAYVVRILAPFVAVFAVYMIAYGHATPGGGFQGGTILGAMLIVVSLVLGRERAERLVPDRWRPWLAASAVLAFVAVGTAGMVFFGPYLTHPSEEGLAWLRSASYVTLEVGIGMGGAVIFASIFRALEGER